MRTGLHCNTTRDHAKILSYYRRSGANVVKLMEFSPDLLNQLKTLGVTIIGRVYEDNQQLGGTRAADFIDRVVRFARDFPQVDYWEGYNEAFQEGNEMQRYGEVEIERMKALEVVGKRAIIGCFSTGQPELDQWQRFRPALEYAAAHGHALGIHEYASPFMQWFTGENQWNFNTNSPVRIDDPCLSPTVEGWLCLRYRKAYKLFKEWGIGDLHLFITEGGIDDINPRPGPQGKGYKDYANTEWARIPGIGDYAQQRRWYMEQLSRDPYTRGAVDFGWDTVDPAWGSFDLSTDPAMLDRIIQLESTLPAGHFGTPPGPDPVDPPPDPRDNPPIGPVWPFIVVESGWTLHEVAERAYPELDLDDAVRAAAKQIALANGLDYAALMQPGQTALLPRYLVVPGYRAIREIQPGPWAPLPSSIPEVGGTTGGPSGSGEQG